MLRFRAVPLILLLALPALADGRATFLEARDALEKAYFDELAPVERDRLFTALGAWDHNEVVKPIAEIASRYGTYLAGIESQLASLQEKLAPLQTRTALSEIDIGLRKGYIADIETKEKEWGRGLASLELLGRTLGSFKEKKTVQTALSTLPKSPTGRVREIFALACGPWHKSLRDDSMSRKLLSALRTLQGDAEVYVRIGVARSLAMFQSSEGLAALGRSLDDADWRVRAVAIQLLHEIKTSEAVGLLIGRMGKETGRLQGDIQHALEDITGLKFAFADVWARWWKSVDGQLPPKATGGGEGTDDGGAAAARKKQDAQFYGIATPSDRICFIIDISGSMKKEVEQFKHVTITGKKETETPVEGKTRLEVAQNELKRAIFNLHSSKQFSIIFFNNAVKLWRPEMVKATPENKKEAFQAIESVVASGATYTLGALREAFTMAGVIQRKQRTPRDGAGIDTIFLLSDGGPTDDSIDDPKPMPADEVLEAVHQWNKNGGLVIHTIAVDTEEVGTYFLKQLAAQNGGQFAERRK